MTGDPWQSARDEFHNWVVPILQEHGMKIGDKARAKDETALACVKYYAMLHRSFDPMTLELLKNTLVELGYMKVKR